MGLILFFLFILIPIAEIFVIIQVGQLIGVGPTLALMVLSAVVGAYLARSQGRQTWAKFNSTMRSGKVPGREVMDGAMIIFGGALLLTPGFLTDLLGISLLLPPSRAAYRRLVKAAAARTPTGRPVFFVYDRMPGTGGGRSGGERRSRGTGGATAGGGGSSTPPRSPGRSSRAYDYEGSAQEIDDSEYALPDSAQETERDD
ncbi:MAG TPA: FxsA family protein [Solirubrobacterales bacterium]|nr:FxsA family protein [Solirubrobacterales bacterium]